MIYPCRPRLAMQGTPHTPDAARKLAGKARMGEVAQRCTARGAIGLRPLAVCCSSGPSACICR